MKRLIYLSPLPWASFAQRPHKLIAWFYARTKSEVLWVDPYPTRLPRWSDLRQSFLHKHNHATHQPPEWLQIIKPTALPIEPLLGLAWINQLCWRGILDALSDFATGHDTLLMIGKPSLLALTALHKLHNVPSIYDAMDDFPAFYTGLSRFTMSYRESRLVRQVDQLWVTSTQLKTRWQRVRPDLHYVPNALDATQLPAPVSTSMHTISKVFGYVGTLAQWFDWEWVIALANHQPNDIIRLIGPLLRHPSTPLPRNIELLPECTHAIALQAMRQFDVGLIPFLRDDLTASVDPIKFYEYRALGLPVLSTYFGEMAFRTQEAGTFISQTLDDIPSLAEAALSFQHDTASTQAFIHNHTWEVRFDATQLLRRL